MKNMLIKLIPYLIAFSIINFIIYKTSDFYKQKTKYVERIESVISSQSEIVFLGDSHVETIKLLDLSDNVGNLAFGADGIEEMYIKILTMLKYNKNLKYIFIATEPQTFNNVRSPNSTFLNKYMLSVTDTMDVYNKTSLNLITDKVPLFNDNYIKFALKEVLAFYKPETQKIDKIWPELSEQERSKIAVKTGKMDHGSIMTKEESLTIYRTLVKLCQSNNIKVIGIRFPVSENYINQASLEDIEKVDHFIESLKLHDHLDYSTEIRDPEYFADEDHLNKVGIEKFAEIISNRTNIRLID